MSQAACKVIDKSAIPRSESPMQRNTVYIIVLNWNGFEDTCACLNSVLNTEGCFYKIVVCDNASTDNSFQRLVQWADDNVVPRLGRANVVSLEANQAESYVCGDSSALYLIQTGSNRGFAGGNNVGIRFSLNQKDSEFLWLLNNDTEVRSDTLAELLKRVRVRPTIGMCGSRLVYYDDRNRIQALGGKINPRLGTTKHVGSGWPADLACDDEALSKEMDYPVGASMLINAELFRKVGLLNEDYFLYYEEIDLVLRAKPHFEVGVASNSIVYHKEGGSIGDDNSDFTDSQFLRSRLIFAKRHYPQYYYLIRLSYALVALNRFRRGCMSQARIAWRFMLHGEN